MARPLFDPSSSLNSKRQDEIGVLLFGEKVAAPAGRTNDLSVTDVVSRACFAEQLPSVECFAVEQRSESGFGARSRPECTADKPEEKENARSPARGPPAK